MCVDLQQQMMWFGEKIKYRVPKRRRFDTLVGLVIDKKLLTDYQLTTILEITFISIFKF
jgi:hypothetical protein